MAIALTYYLDVMSSWCFYTEPNLRRLLDSYGDRIEYTWRIAMVTDTGHSRQQYDWFYQRSGSISGIHLNSGWFTPFENSFVPNSAAEAARELGFSEDRVRLALARAALIEGKRVLDPAVSAQIVAEVTGLQADKIAEMMSDHHIRERIEASCAEFAKLGVDQRPTFVLRSEIGDAAIFSGIWLYEPLHATIGAMLSDADKYAHFAANNPPMPQD